ncbi:MAG: pur operon repressor [Acetobacteraceae bacterium]|nr:pur operon repressor [Acetobacteraceae bacterium]
MALILRTLVDQPSSLFSLGHFAEACGTTRSSISEDIALIKEALESRDLGRVETVAGAAGGVRFLPVLTPDAIRQRAAELCRHLAWPDRVLPGGFLYMTDIIFSPRWSALIGQAFATLFLRSNADCVVTVETKGIPLALMTARSLGLPLVILRRNARATEGPAVSINYVSGSSGRIESMSLPRRALAPGARALLIDDFMRGGGTARGVCELLAEFEAKVAGIGVLVETAQPRQKLVDDYTSLLVLESIDPSSGRVGIVPSPRLG